MIYLLHQIPIWLAGTIICGALIGASIGGIHLVGRFDPPEKRHEYGDTVGFVIGAVGVVQAVILAWVAVMAWENYDRAALQVESEASYAGDIARVASGLPVQQAVRIRGEVRRYADLVVRAEWTQMREGERPTAALRDLQLLQKSIVAISPEGKSEANLHAELLAKLTALLDARRGRSFQSEHGIAGVIWSVLILGSLCLLGLSFFFGLEKQRHRIMTSTVAFSMGLVLLMIETMDRPYLGGRGIAPDAFVQMLDTMQQDESGS